MYLLSWVDMPRCDFQMASKSSKFCTLNFWIDIPSYDLQVIHQILYKHCAPHFLNWYTRLYTDTVLKWSKFLDAFLCRCSDLIWLEKISKWFEIQHSTCAALETQTKIKTRNLRQLFLDLDTGPRVIFVKADRPCQTVWQLLVCFVATTTTIAENNKISNEI